jgi:hypothetical protein
MTAYVLGDPASTGQVEQNIADDGDGSEGRDSDFEGRMMMNNFDGGAATDQPTGCSESAYPVPSGNSDKMATAAAAVVGQNVENSIVVLAEEVELEPSAAVKLPGSIRLFVTVSAFL